VALVEIGLLWCAAVLTTVIFFQISPRAAQLMLPYLLWLTFATTLNYRIWRDNRPGHETTGDDGTPERSGEGES
jgi:tryptophan-rich sensory protein